MKDAQIDDKEVEHIMKDIEGKCEICTKYKKKMTRPKTSLPKARFLNEVVSIDLKTVSNILNKMDVRQIVYMTDELSKWTVGRVTKNKDPENVIKVMRRDFPSSSSPFSLPQFTLLTIPHRFNYFPTPMLLPTDLLNQDCSLVVFF